jgi:Fe-S-cluster containining protein
MSGPLIPVLPRALARRAERLLADVDATLARGARRASASLACRVGCTDCCIGVFDVTPLDAAHLAAGLLELALADPPRAAAIATRAREQWRQLAPRFPGDAQRGVLAGDEEARASFFLQYEGIPCPCLDPADGACALYEHRPLSCRTFGLPVRCGGIYLEPCRLNLVGAADEEIERARVEVDPYDEEGAILDALTETDPEQGDTLVCVALLAASSYDEPLIGRRCDSGS